MKKVLYLAFCLLLFESCHHELYHEKVMAKLQETNSKVDFTNGLIWHSENADENPPTCLDSLCMYFYSFREKVYELDELYKNRNIYYDSLRKELNYLNVYYEKYSLSLELIGDIINLYKRPDFIQYLLKQYGINEIHDILSTYNKEMNEVNESVSNEFKKLKSRLSCAKSEEQGRVIAKDYIDNDRILWYPIFIMINQFDFLLSPLME